EDGIRDDLVTRVQTCALPIFQQVAQRCAPIGIAVLFVDGYLTLTSDQAARAAAILASPTVIPAHVEGWDHYTECIDDVRAAFAQIGRASCRERGEDSVGAEGV